MQSSFKYSQNDYYIDESDDQQFKVTKESSGIKFCTQCQNLLYPTQLVCADQVNQGNYAMTKGKLIFKCIHCGWSIDADPFNADDNTVFKNDVNEGVTAIIDKEAALDPALPRDKSVQCPKCGYKQAVYFQDTSTGGKEGMDMIYVCAKIQNPICGEWWYKRPRQNRVKKDEF